MTDAPPPSGAGRPAGGDTPPPVAPGPAPGLAYVGFWRRTGGYLIDLLVLLAPFIVVVMGFTHETRSVEGGVVITTPTVERAGYLAGGLIALAYLAGQWYAFGRTLGQRAVGISVVSAADGGRPDGISAVLRAGYLTSGWFADAIAPVLGELVALGLFVGLLMVAADRRKQGWHDRLARTLVVHRLPTPACTRSTRASSGDAIMGNLEAHREAPGTTDQWRQ